MTYLEYDVLQLNYNRLGDIGERLLRKFALLDSGTGLRVSDEQSPAPAASRSFTWTALDRAEIAAMRTFLDARVGRAVPFWFPSFQWDLCLAEDVKASQSTISIQSVRYCEHMWGTTGARRHLALWALGIGAMDFYRVDACVDPEDGLTETLELDPAAVRAYPAQTSVISFLKFCRLEDDLVEVSYLARDIAEATIRVRELPLEAPV